MARKGLKEYRGVAVPDVHIAILVHKQIRIEGNQERQLLKRTFTSADYKVTVNAAKTAADDVLSLAMSGELACQSSRVEIPQQYFLEEII